MITGTILGFLGIVKRTMYPQTPFQLLRPLHYTNGLINYQYRFILLGFHVLGLSDYRLVFKSLGLRVLGFVGF